MPSSALLDHALLAAHRAADAAAEVIAAARSSGEWSVSHKADQSPVTEVDVAAEKAIHAVLADALPEAGFYGEETGRSAAQGGGEESVALTWLVDPIDGTKSFIRGSPFYSTQIALLAGTELVVGVSNAPAYGERLAARVGRGALLNGTQVQCRNTTCIEAAFLSSGNIGSLAADDAAWLRYGRLLSRVQRVRGYGDFCHYHQLCCGQADIVIESDLNILDIAALTVAVRMAGGVMTTLEGGPIGLETRSVLAASTAELHAKVLALMRGE